MDLKQFFKDDMIWTNVEVETKEDLLNLIAEKGLELGYVTPNYLVKVKEREAVFPTGLQLDGYGVAIPHTDPEHVTEQFIAVITSKKGITFQSMSDIDEAVSCNVIFALGLNEPHNQLQALQQLMKTIQDKEIIGALLAAETKEDVYKVFEN